MRFAFPMSRLSPFPLARSTWCTALLTSLGILVSQETRAASNWPSSLTRDPRGSFPDLRPARATYVYGWSGITAATSDVYFHRGDQRTFVLEGRGRTVGLARVLWRFDLDYRSAANAETLRPLDTHQVETVRGKRVETNLKFSDEGVSGSRVESNHATPAVKDFNLENLYDLHSAFLYLRSQPLRDHSVYRVAVYPANSAYVATLTVVGREHLRVRAGSYNAIKLDLKLQRVSKKNELEPHRKFKRATIWISDDNDRMLLRIEGQIFVGTVTTELQSVTFERAQ
ncbi:MAG: hypothetical protein DMF15_02885 [Verrucomicrobia bacterium]|nr:MAG: hypothetical protein DMF15_02885 [Verrucomicrobiota bacterium]